MAKKRYSHKQIRKSIKQNELRDFINEAIAFGKKNTENILITGIIVVVIIVLVPLYFSNKQKNEERATGMLNRAMNYSMQPLAEGMVDPNSGAFRSADEKYKKVQQTFAEITGTYRNTKAAQIAKIGEANASFYLKEYDKAKGLYEEAKLKVKDTQLRLTLDERIAACLESQGKWEDALAVYRNILTTSPNYFNKHSVRMRMAQCYLKLNNLVEAKKLWQAEKDKNPGSYWSELARQQLALNQPDK